MEEEKEPIMATSEEVSQQFKTLTDSGDVDAVKQLQHTIMKETDSAPILACPVRCLGGPYRLWYVRHGHGADYLDTNTVLFSFAIGYLFSAGKFIILGVTSILNQIRNACSNWEDCKTASFTDVSGDFSRNLRLVKSIKSDLDHIFMKLRSMKGKLSAAYPDAFPESSTTIMDQRTDLERPMQ